MHRKRYGKNANGITHPIYHKSTYCNIVLYIYNITINRAYQFCTVQRSQSSPFDIERSHQAEYLWQLRLTWSVHCRAIRRGECQCVLRGYIAGVQGKMHRKNQPKNANKKELKFTVDPFFFCSQACFIVCAIVTGCFCCCCCCCCCNFCCGKYKPAPHDHDAKNYETLHVSWCRAQSSRRFRRMNKYIEQNWRHGQGQCWGRVGGRWGLLHSQFQRQKKRGLLHESMCK